jgi:hypothetical protein
VDLCKQARMSGADTDTFYAIAPDLIPVLARNRSGKYRSKLIQTPGVVTKGSMTSDSSYVIMVPKKIDLHLPVDRLVSMTFDAGSHTRDTDLYHLVRIYKTIALTTCMMMLSLLNTVSKTNQEIYGWDRSIRLGWNYIQTFDNCRMAKLAMVMQKMTHRWE